MHSFVRVFINELINSCIHSFVWSFIHSFIHAFIRAFMRSCVRSFVRSFARSLAPFIHSSIHAFNVVPNLYNVLSSDSLYSEERIRFWLPGLMALKVSDIQHNIITGLERHDKSLMTQNMLFLGELYF